MKSFLGIREISNYASTESFTPRIPSHRTQSDNPENAKPKIDIETRETAFSLLGAIENQPKIVGGALDGYRMIGIPDLDVVCIEKYETNSRRGIIPATNNATYVLPYQQAEYYARNCNKSDLRDADCVIAVNHSKNWAKRIIDACIALNPKSKDKLKQGKSYSDEVQYIIDSVRTNYEENSR